MREEHQWHTDQGLSAFEGVVPAGRTRRSGGGSRGSRPSPMIAASSGGRTSTPCCVARACACVPSTPEWRPSSSTRISSVRFSAGMPRRLRVFARRLTTMTTSSCAQLSSTSSGAASVTAGGSSARGVERLCRHASMGRLRPGNVGGGRRALGGSASTRADSRRRRPADRRFRTAASGNARHEQHCRLHGPRCPGHRLDRRSVGQLRCPLPRTGLVEPMATIASPRIHYYALCDSIPAHFRTRCRAANVPEIRRRDSIR